MKKISFIIGLLMVFTHNIQAQERVIEQPPFLAWSGSIIEIDKIVQSEEATVLHIKAFFRPNYWIQIPKVTYLIADNGEKYQIVKADGIPIDEKYFMPESGETAFTLTFPPLPASVEQVDFIEEVDDGFKIWGIQLKDKKTPKPNLPKEVAKSKINKKATLPVPELKKGKAVLKGKLLEYRPGILNELNIYIATPVATEQKDVIPVNPDGTFHLEADLISPTPCLLYLGEAINFYLAPGQETTLYINTRELYRRQSKLRKAEKPSGKSIYFDGYMAGVSEEYNEQIRLLTKENNDLYADIQGKDLSGIKDYFFARYKNQKEKVASLKVSEACKQLLYTYLDATTAINLAMGKNYLVSSLLETKKLKREEANDYYSKLQMPNDYYEGIEALAGLNTPTALYSTPYPGVIRDSQFKDEFSKALGTGQGIYFDLAKAGSILNKLNDFTPLTQEDKEELASLSSPAFLELAEESNEKLLAIIEANKKKTGFRINEAGEVSNEDLFASIISKFSGKVILVDFWATWCGPCRMANKEMAPMKEELKDQDIVYLYIAGENSPMGTWQNMIPDIHGEHYRVTEAQWKYLRDTFKVEGVPTYLVVDRKGDISFKTTGYPGADKMKEELMKAVK